MTQEWGCPRGHRWQPPVATSKKKNGKIDVCPICGAPGSPTVMERSGHAPTEQMLPAFANEQNLSSDATLLPPGAKAPTHHDQTLVGSSNSARVETDTSSGSASALSSDHTVIGPNLSAPGGGSNHDATSWLQQDVDQSSRTPVSNAWSGSFRSADSTKPTIAGYEILGILGRGAMGVVYKARQLGLNRIVALKMILSGEHAGEDDLFRFKTEAEAVAGLQHPNIVQIYEVGDREGRPFFSLEFIDGGGLDQKIGGKPLPVLEAARIVEALARAMHFAHERNILHRDLKSANVLLTQDGVPKITDFGLAKRLGQDSGRTGSGSILGTPSYMSPEQAQGKTRELTGAMDIYALGAILYDCLTGRPPFAGESILDTLLQVETTDPVPPSRLQPKVPSDLETICLKCLEKDPRRRYISAGALADDIGRFQRGEPILARPITIWERGAKWARRRPAIAGLLLLLTVVVLSSLVLLSVFLHRAEAGWTEAEEQAGIALQAKATAEQSEVKAKEEKSNAEKSEGKAQLARADAVAHLDKQQRTYYGAKMNLALEAFREGRVVQFRSQMDDQDPKLKQFRAFEWDYLKRLRDSKVAELRGHVQGVRQVVFQPREFEKLASGGADGAIVLWDPRAANPAKRILREHTGAITHLAYSAAGDKLVSAGTDKKVCLWTLASEEKPMVWSQHAGAVLSTALDAGGTRVAAGGDEGTIFVWKSDEQKPLIALKKHVYPVLGLAFSPKDDNRLASVGMDKKLRIWDIAAGEEVYEQSFSHWPTCVAYKPTGEYVVVGGWDRHVHVIHLNPKKTFTLEQLDLPVRQVGFSPDPASPLLAIELHDGSVQVWNLETRKFVKLFRKEEGIVRSVAFDEFGQQLASVNFDRLVKEFQEYENPQALLCLTPTDQETTFLAGGAAGGLFAWDLDDAKKEPSTLGSHDGALKALVSLPQKSLYFSGGEDGAIRRWSRKDKGGWEHKEVGRHDSWVMALAVHPQGKWLASAEWGPGVTLWDLASGKMGKRMDDKVGSPTSLNAQRVLSLAFSNDGNYLLSGATDGNLRVWNTSTHELLPQNINIKSPVFCLAVDPKGHWVAAGLEDHSVRLFHMGEGGKLVEMKEGIKGHSGPITALAFSKDGSRLITGSADRLVKIWDPQSRQEILTFKGHEHGIVGLAFSPDGRRLISADQGGKLLRWETKAE